MQQVWAKSALLPGGWARDVRIDIADGRIARVTPGAGRTGETVGVVVSAPANGHSHAFQRAMAGLSEKRGPAHDSFWTWRDLMFRFLERLTPDQVEAIAAYVQIEMLETGFGASVEFHYLHHGPDGTPYATLHEMSERIVAAAAQSGIGLTLLPVMYQYGGCDGRALTRGQVRFGNDIDRFGRLLEGAARSLSALPGDAVLGVAPHSLRAVAAGDIPRLAAMRSESPVHMHLAEQVAEVAEVEAHLGARPVSWLLDNLALSDRWSLIHCTQMTPGETIRLAQSGVVAGLCPLTEASLGDGVFDGVHWLEAGGSVAIGSDSNIRISLPEELRQLETTQRLRDLCRAALAGPGASTGRRLMDAAAHGGAVASGRGAGRIAEGEWADLLALDTTHVDLEGLSGDTLLDAFVVAGDRSMVRHVWSGGRHLVRDGRHTRREAIESAYRRAIGDLRADL